MQILAMIGSIICIVGWVWTIVTAFKKGGVLWGILNLLLLPIQPLVGIITAALKKAQWLPVILMIIGVILATVANFPKMVNAINQMSR